MAKLSTLSPSGTQRVLVYGPPKTGKTELVGRLAEHFNLIWFDIENGHDTLFKLPVEWQERIEVISIPDSRSFPMAAETMLKVIKGGEHQICEEHGKVFCLDCMKQGKPTVKVRLDHTLPRDTVVVVDSLTQLSTSFIAHITKDMAELYKMQTDDWGNLAKLVEIFLSHVQAAKFNVICISHETETDLEDGKTRIVPVSGSRNSSRNTAKYFDHVVYAEVKNGKHQFGSGTLYANGIVTGSRTGATLENMATPSLMDIMKGIVPTNKSMTPGQVAAASLDSLSAALAAKNAAANNPLNKAKG